MTVVTWSGLQQVSAANRTDTLSIRIDVRQAEKLARLAYGCIHTEYANHIQHLMLSDRDAATPSQLHPAFYGCYDWHSSVHGHWLLVKLLKNFPQMQVRDSIIAAMDLSLTKENIAAEVDYFKVKGRISYERPYGWGWLLKLAAELADWDDPLGKKWSAVLRPLTDQIVDNFETYLPGLYYPLRRGVHANTAFALYLALDWATLSGDTHFEALLKERAKFYFQQDKRIPAAWEPEGDDFLSPALMEANLMRKVMDEKTFAKWFRTFLPGLPASLSHPAVVADRSDPTGVHLDGLNLSRAWCMNEIAAALRSAGRQPVLLEQTAKLHAGDALPHVLSDNYLGTHWLATFALLYYFSDPGLKH